MSAYYPIMDVSRSVKILMALTFVPAMVGTTRLDLELAMVSIFSDNRIIIFLN